MKTSMRIALASVAAAGLLTGTGIAGGPIHKDPFAEGPGKRAVQQVHAAIPLNELTCQVMKKAGNPKFGPAFVSCKSKAVRRTAACRRACERHS